MACWYACTAKGWKAARHDRLGALLDVTGKMVDGLTEDDLYVFSQCDGLHDFASPAFLPRHRVALRRLMQLGVVERCPRGFHGGAPDIQGALWAVTGRCNMKCRHCYMGVPEGQSELPYNDMARFARAARPRWS